MTLSASFGECAPSCARTASPSQQYVTELTYLLFLKMMRELGREEDVRNDRKIICIPKGMRWAGLVGENGLDQLQLYREMLTVLGNLRTRVNKEGNIVEAPVKDITSDEAQNRQRAYDKADPLPSTVQAILPTRQLSCVNQRTSRT
ncbi:hypothetical protein [Leisingera sp. JC11]|uniref:hypothetical protein n=1 Tax=Leisingera sp. JC11 TaxID=3042469 RepID=UPI003451A10E